MVVVVALCMYVHEYMCVYAYVFIKNKPKWAMMCEREEMKLLIFY